MPLVAQFKVWLLTILLAAGAGSPAAADYPDYTPTAPPAESEERAAPFPEDAPVARPVEATEPVDRYQPAEAQRSNGLRQPGDLRQANDVRPPNDLRQPADAPPPINARRVADDRPAADLRRADEAARTRDLQRPGEAGPGSDAGETAVAPRSLPVRFQPVDYQAPVETQPASEMDAAPQRQASVQPALQPAPPQNAIPLVSQSAPTRSLLHGPDVPPLVAGAASLGIVLGLFMLVAFVVRRGMPKNAALLPRDAVEVLGRAPLVGRDQVYLLRCGNKLVLVSMAGGKAETLTEITDPLEVDRLAGICQQMNPNSVSSSFRQIFQQFGQPSQARDYLSQRQAEDLDYGAGDEIGYAQESRA